MLRLNEARSLLQYESFGCKCGLNKSVYNRKQKWNNDEECASINIQMVGVLVTIITCRILVHVIVSE